MGTESNATKPKGAGPSRQVDHSRTQTIIADILGCWLLLLVIVAAIVHWEQNNNPWRNNIFGISASHYIEIINEEENFFAVLMYVCHIFSVRICTQVKRRIERNRALEHFHSIVTAHAGVRLFPIGIPLNSRFEIAFVVIGGTVSRTTGPTDLHFDLGQTIFHLPLLSVEFCTKGSILWLEHKQSFT